MQTIKDVDWWSRGRGQSSCVEAMSEIDESWRECGADGQEGVGAMLDFRCICRVVDWRDLLQLVRTIPLGVHLQRFEFSSWRLQ